MRRLARVLLLMLVACTPLAGSATAATTAPVVYEQSGWWFVLQQLPPPLLLPAPPNVPVGGFTVIYSGIEIPDLHLPVNLPISGTLAYGAVRFQVPASSSGHITLKVALGSTALTAQLRACQTTGAWEPAAAGAWYAQPGVDKTSCSDGVVSPDGTSVKFPISSRLTTDGAIDVAIVPRPGTSPLAIVFDKPTATDVAVTGGRATVDPVVASIPPVSDPIGPTPAPAGDLGIPDLSGDTPGGLATPPTPVVSPDLPASDLLRTGVDGPSGATRAAAFSLVALLLGMAWLVSSPGRVYLFAAAGDQRRDPDARNVFGIGRFARDRSDPPSA